jgi:uncharacterized protein YtpQ (UPF0354 family)
VVIGVVIDDGSTYGFVIERERARWNIGADALFAQASANLDELSKHTQIQGGKGPDRWLAIEDGDGYDAAKLLLPWVREESSKVLGEPFRVGIPNRDFLIMWSEKNGDAFQQFARTKVKDGFSGRPYPLSPLVLRVWKDGRIEVER